MKTTIILLILVFAACTSIDSPNSAAPAATTLSPSAVSSLTAAGTAIGTALGKTPSSSGLAMAGALVPVLYSLAPTTSTPTTALAASIVSAIPAETSKSVPSITLAAANIATALNTASPSTTTAQVAAIATLGSAIETALYPNAQGPKGQHGIRYQPASTLKPYSIRAALYRRELRKGSIEPEIYQNLLLDLGALEEMDRIDAHSVFASKH